MPERKTLLIVSQVYVPDPASVGQHMHDTAVMMTQRGWRVIVYTSARGYENPTARYPKREVLDGVEIRRLPLSSFGKSSIAVRLLGGFIFLFQVMARTLFGRKPDVALVSTSPPMAMLAGVWLKVLRKVPTVFWAMDINPDQMIAMGKITERSMFARTFNAMDKAILKRADAVVALDKFMAESLERKVAVGERMHIMPPWPIGDELRPVAHDSNDFRREQGLEDKFVIMYSGNISPAHPIYTILEAARQLQDQPQLLFLFIGGGLARKQIESFVEEHGLSNVKTLPYQPLEMLSYSLSAADVHLVSMGDDMVGIVHPCKVYGALTVARPVLLVGPEHCHVGEILSEYDCGWQVAHGEVERAVEVIREMLAMSREQWSEMCQRSDTASQGKLSRASLAGGFCDVLESVSTSGELG